MTQFTLQDIERDHTIKQFMNIKSGLREKSIIDYIYILKEFCNHTGESPTAIRDLYRQDLNKNRI